MKKLILSLLLATTYLVSCSQTKGFLQYDSTILQKTGRNAELIIRNGSRNVPGFLFNTGNGATQFKHALVKLNSSTYLVGADTLTVPYIDASQYYLASNPSNYISNILGIAASGDLSGTYPNPSVAKLNGQLPAYYLNRSNQIGTQVASTISDFTITATTIGDARYPQLSSTYADPSWLTSLSTTKLTGTIPATILASGTPTDGYIPKIVSGVPTWSIAPTGGSTYANGTATNQALVWNNTTYAPTAINQAFVGLGNVNNTSDANKPVSTATQTALNLKANQSALQDTASALRAAFGSGTGTGGTTDTLPLHYQIVDLQNGLAAHTSNVSNPHSVTASQVGLGNVDNTSDATKNSATVTLTNKTLSGSSNTFSNIPESAITNLSTDLTSKEAAIVAPRTTNKYWNGYKAFVSLNSDSIAQGSTNLFLTAAERTKLSNTSGTNTGDETQSSIQSKLGAASATTSGYLSSTDWSAFNSKASLSSPAFTGTPTAPTATNGTNTTQLATTAFVQTAVTGKQNTITTGTTAQYFRGDLSLSSFATDVATAANSLYPSLSGAYANPAWITSLPFTKITGTNSTAQLAIGLATEGYVVKIVSGTPTWSNSAYVVQQVVTSGATSTVSNGTGWYIYDPAATVASLAITLPASPSDGQLIDFSFGGTMTSGTVVTSFSIVPNTGQTIIQQSAATTVQAGESLRFRFNTAKSIWYRLK